MGSGVRSGLKSDQYRQKEIVWVGEDELLGIFVSGNCWSSHGCVEGSSTRVEK